MPQDWHMLTKDPLHHGGALAATGLLSLALAACTQGEPEPTATASATSTTSSSAAPTTPAAASPRIVTAPDERPGLATLVEASGYGNASSSWQVSVEKGVVWLDLNCVGDGQVEVSGEPVVKLTVPCEASSTTPSLNRIKVAKDTVWSADVTAAPAVAWAVRVSQ